MPYLLPRRSHLLSDQEVDQQGVLGREKAPSEDRMSDSLKHRLAGAACALFIAAVFVGFGIIVGVWAAHHGVF
jgi:hypothetical protein